MVEGQRAVMFGELGATYITEVQPLGATRRRDGGKGATRVNLSGRGNWLDTSCSVGVDTAV